MSTLINRLSNYQQFLSTKSSSSSLFKRTVGVVQFGATENRKINFEKSSYYIGESVKRGASMVCLPEHFAFQKLGPGAENFVSD